MHLLGVDGMAATSACPAELQHLAASLQNWGEVLDLRQAQLGALVTTTVDAHLVRALAVRVRSIANVVDQTARFFAAADLSSAGTANLSSTSKRTTAKLTAITKAKTNAKTNARTNPNANPKSKAMPQGWQEAIARKHMAQKNAKALAALKQGIATNKNRAEQLKALVNDPTATYLRADGTGDGRVVQVFGDLVSAQHIIFFVPGMDNEINDYRGSLQRRAQSVLAEMQRQAGPGVPVAVVAWLGYDTPDYTPVRLVTQAATSNKARDGARALEADIACARLQNPSAHITVLAHSYGTVVLAEAMQRGLKVSDAIAVGSPGMNTNSRKFLLSPNVKFWASKSQKTAWSLGFRKVLTMPDPISVLPTHGEDPSAKGFGANRFSSGDSIGHSDYFRTGTAALRNIVAIGLGRPPTFTPEPTKKPVKPPRRTKRSPPFICQTSWRSEEQTEAVARSLWPAGNLQCVLKWGT
jgi:Alpha/beta hydrolase